MAACRYCGCEMRRPSVDVRRSDFDPGCVEFVIDRSCACSEEIILLRLPVAVAIGRDLQVVAEGESLFLRKEEAS